MLAKIRERITGFIKNTVIKNIMLVGGITLVVKLVSFYKETMVAANFGLSEILDTFLIAMLIPGFISNVFLNSFKNVFIPNYVAEMRVSKNMNAFQGTGFFITISVSLLLVILAFLGTDVFLEVLFPGHTPEYYALIKKQFYLILPCIILWGTMSLLSGLLNIAGEFKWVTMSGLIGPSVLIICLYFFQDLMGESVLALATLIGSVLAFIYLLSLSLSRGLIQLAWPDFKNKNAKIMFQQVPAKVSSSFLTGLHSVIEAYFAAQLVVGSVSALNYGVKMPAFAVSIAVIAISNVLLPYFSKMVIDDKQKAFQNLSRILRFVFISGIIVAVLGILTTDFFVSLFFERREFTSEDSLIVGQIQKIILIYLPFKISGMLLVNFLTSINKNYFMAMVAFISVVTNFVLNYILIQYYGVLGIAMSTTIVVIIRNMILLWYTFRQKKLMLKPS